MTKQVFCDQCDEQISKDELESNNYFECLDCGDFVCFNCVDMGNIGRHTFEDEE